MNQSNLATLQALQNSNITASGMSNLSSQFKLLNPPPSQSVLASRYNTSSLLPRSFTNPQCQTYLKTQIQLVRLLQTLLLPHQSPMPTIHQLRRLPPPTSLARSSLPISLKMAIQAYSPRFLLPWTFPVDGVVLSTVQFLPPSLVHRTGSMSTHKL